jgi:hypothetical protein
MTRSRRILSALGLAVALTATASACTVTTTGHARVRTGAVVVYSEPPPPRYERVEYRAGYTYIKGHWEWQGDRWDWVPGYYERERGGYVWVDGYWEQRGTSWHWVTGRWSSSGDGYVENDRPRVYRERERARVIDRRTPPPVEQAPVSDYPSQPPPPVRVESPGPRSGYIWITGRWDWRRGQWEWIPGHWERQRARMVWTPGRWELRGNVYVWIEGSWGPQ